MGVKFPVFRKKGTSKDLLERFSRHYESTLEERHPNGPRPSAIFGCLRSHWYDLHRQPYTDPFDPKISLMGIAGTARHAWWQDNLLASGMVESRDYIEIELERDENNMNGFIDAETPEEVVLDLKTISPFGYKSVVKNGAREKDVGQVLYYMRRRGRKKGVIWYECRATFQWHLEEVDMNGPVEQEILRKLDERIAAVLIADKHPKREYSISSVWCKGCQYRTRCWDTDKEIV
jgi:hypothetical protein